MAGRQCAGTAAVRWMSRSATRKTSIFASVVEADSACMLLPAASVGPLSAKSIWSVQNCATVDRVSGYWWASQLSAGGADFGDGI